MEYMSITSSQGIDGNFKSHNVESAFRNATTSDNMPVIVPPIKSQGIKTNDLILQSGVLAKIIKVLFVSLDIMLYICN